MVFYKSCSSGNDFLLVDVAELKAPPLPAQVKHWCDRHHGVGADGLIVYDRSHKPVSFRIFNQDGLEAELSGNGMAGLVALLVQLDPTDDLVELLGKSGLYRHRVTHSQRSQCTIQIDLGEPDFTNHFFFPFLNDMKQTPWIEGVQYRNVRFFPVAVGNPQVVIFKTPDQSVEDALILAETVHQDEIFPYRTNVSILENPAREEAKIYFFERGVGRTLSSSTGTAGAYAVMRVLRPGLSSYSFISPGGGVAKVSGNERIYIENHPRIVYKGKYLESVDE